jgi:uncharacterized damage-inducible protein DinB
MMSAMPSLSSSTLYSLFAYKAWANRELFAALACVDAAAHPAPVHRAIRILNHVYVVDVIFKAHLEGVRHSYTASNTKETPALQSLAIAVQELDAWYLAYTSAISPSALEEQIAFTFTDADAGLMRREEILLHIITHGAYHRGAAGEMMNGTSVAAPRDLLTRFLHATEPARRSEAVT